jgi:hypothetical protein
MGRDPGRAVSFPGTALANPDEEGPPDLLDSLSTNARAGMVLHFSTMPSERRNGA